MASSKNHFISKAKAVPYDYSNKIANAMISDDETWFIVQGPAGRVPVMADDEAAAVARYVERTYDKYAEQNNTD